MSLNEIAEEKLNDYSIEQFHVAGKMYSLICRNKKIVIPKQKQITFVKCYYPMLKIGWRKTLLVLTLT